MKQQQFCSKHFVLSPVASGRWSILTLRNRRRSPLPNETEQEGHMRSRLRVHVIEIAKGNIAENTRKVTAQFAELLIDLTSCHRVKNYDWQAWLTELKFANHREKIANETKRINLIDHRFSNKLHWVHNPSYIVPHQSGSVVANPNFTQIHFYLKCVNEGVVVEDDVR